MTVGGDHVARTQRVAVGKHQLHVVAGRRDVLDGALLPHVHTAPAGERHEGGVEISAGRDRGVQSVTGGQWEGHPAS